MSLLHADIKNHHLKLFVCFLAQFDVSFHCPESVDRYKVAFQNHQILQVDQSGEISQPSNSFCGGSWGSSWSPLLI